MCHRGRLHSGCRRGCHSLLCGASRLPTSRMSSRGLFRRQLLFGSSSHEPHLGIPLPYLYIWIPEFGRLGMGMLNRKTVRRGLSQPYCFKSYWSTLAPCPCTCAVCLKKNEKEDRANLC